jgi:hypothetical protein
MPRSPFRVDALDDDDFNDDGDPYETCRGCGAGFDEHHDDDCPYADDEDDDGLGEDTDDESDDPDPDAADFQGLMHMHIPDPGLLDLAARLLHGHPDERVTWKAKQ